MNQTIKTVINQQGLLNMRATKAIIFPMVSLLLAGCDFSSPFGSSEQLKNEAYSAGWNSIWNERCKNMTLPLMIPGKYDDSTKSGELVGYYRSGISDATTNPKLCE